jgi:hypothetical protein
MVEYYKSKRFVDRLKWVIVDENGKIINRNPSKEELIGLEKENYCRRHTDYNETNTCQTIKEDGTLCENSLTKGKSYRKYDINDDRTNEWVCGTCHRKHNHNRKNIIYNETNVCQEIKNDGSICGRSLIPGDTCQKRGIYGIKTDIWICANCYRNYSQKNDPNSHNNIRHLLQDYKIGNQDPNSEQVKGDNHQELACILYGWEDLNKKLDNHKTPIDCYDPKTGLYHQVQGRYYNYERGFWPFAQFERERSKKYENIICFCFSKDEKTVERIYKFPEIVAKIKGSATIVKNSSRRPGWYEEYRVKDKDELKKANEIWKEIYKRWKGSENNI